MSKKFNRFLFFSCPHFTMTSPQNRKENYGELILEKLIWIIDKADYLQANLVCLGDWFHKKTGVTEHEKICMMRLLEDRNVITVLGNHDIQAYNQNTDTQAIGILEQAGCVDLSEDWKFFNSKGQFIHMTAVNYHADYNVPETLSVKGDADAMFHIHLTHALLTKQSLPYETLKIEDVEINADLLINGHFHEAWSSEEDGVYNTGAVARIAMTDNGMTKTPKCLYVEVNERITMKKDNVIEWIDIPCEEDVWMKRTTRETMDNEEVDKFVEKMRETGMLQNQESILADLLSKVDAEIAEDVKIKVKTLLENEESKY